MYKRQEQGAEDAKVSLLKLKSRIEGPNFLRREFQQLRKRSNSAGLVEELLVFASVFTELGWDSDSAEALAQVLTIQEEMHGKDSIETTELEVCLQVHLRNCGMIKGFLSY